MNAMSDDQYEEAKQAIFSINDAASKVDEAIENIREALA